jgi:hypothetical protein
MERRIKQRLNRREGRSRRFEQKDAKGAKGEG